MMTLNIRNYQNGISNVDVEELATRRIPAYAKVLYGVSVLP